MDYGISFLVGVFLAMLIIAILIEALVWQRVCDDPLAGKLLSALSGWLVASMLAGWGLATDGPYWGAFIDCAFPALFLAALAYNRGMALRKTCAADEETI